MNIENIITTAKETMLAQQGCWIPTLFVEQDTDDICIYAITGLRGTTRDRQEALFTIGEQHASLHPGKIREACYIVEMWLSTAHVNGIPVYRRPSDDPQRKEALMIMHLTVSTGKTMAHILEILRSDIGSIDLLHRSEEHKEVHDYLLPYFVGGAAGALMSDQEIVQLMHRKVKR